MTFKEDFKPSKVYNKLVNDVCYNADCLEEFEKQRLVVANPFSYNKSTRTGIIAEFDNGYHLSKEVGIKRNFVTIGMRVWDIIRKNRQKGSRFLPVFLYFFMVKCTSPVFYTVR